LLLVMPGSALAGSAWSIGALIGLGVRHGSGAGIILPAGQTILARKAERQRMGRVICVAGAASRAAAGLIAAALLPAVLPPRPAAPAAAPFGGGQGTGGEEDDARKAQR
jgi:hypothetical protein